MADDSIFWSKQGEKAGIGTAVVFIQERAADLFLVGKDTEAKAMRELAQQVAALKDKVKP